MGTTKKNIYRKNKTLKSLRKYKGGANDAKFDSANDTLNITVDNSSVDNITIEFFDNNNNPIETITFNNSELNPTSIVNNIKPTINSNNKSAVISFYDNTNALINNAITIPLSSNNKIKVAVTNNPANYSSSTPAPASTAAPTNSAASFMQALTSLMPTLTPPVQSKTFQKIVPTNKDDHVDIISSTTNGNLNKITLMYNGISINNITITGLEFESGGVPYKYQDKILTNKNAPTATINQELVSAAQYLATLNLAFYTDPNAGHTFP